MADSTYNPIVGGRSIGSDASMQQQQQRTEYVKAPVVDSNVAMLRHTHADYEKQLPFWQKYTDCYESNDIYRYIHKHLRESDESFNLRVKRGYYYNYTASIVDLYVSYLFQAPISRRVTSGDSSESKDSEEAAADESIHELFESIYRDADLNNTDYSVFMQNVATYAQICGQSAVLIDMPTIDPETIVSEQDRKENNIRPYLCAIHSQQIMDWRLDNYGRFEWVKLRIHREELREWNTPVAGCNENYVIWTRKTWEEWQIFKDVNGNEAATKISFGEHDLGEVPLVIVRNGPMPRHQWFGMSAVKDIADINLAILNWSSFGDEEICNRCLNVLAMERDANDAPPVISHSNVLEYPSGTQPPQYLAPGSTPLELIGKWIDRAKDEIYRIAKLGGSTGLLGVREATSGIAYAFEFNETNQSLAHKADSLQEAEMNIHRLIAKWANKKCKCTVVYPDEFGVQDFLLELQILAESRSNLTSETAVKELQKKVASRMFSSESQELRDKIEKEIDTASVMPLGYAESFGTVPSEVTRGPASDSQDGESTRLGR